MTKGKKIFACYQCGGFEDFKEDALSWRCIYCDNNAALISISPDCLIVWAERKGRKFLPLCRHCGQQIKKDWWSGDWVHTRFKNAMCNGSDGYDEDGLPVPDGVLAISDEKRGHEPLMAKLFGCQTCDLNGLFGGGCIGCSPGQVARGRPGVINWRSNALPVWKERKGRI